MAIDTTRIIYRLSVIALLLIIPCWTAVATARPYDKVTLPDPVGYVSDHAGVIDAEWKARIPLVCQDLDQNRCGMLWSSAYWLHVATPTTMPRRSINVYRNGAG